MVTYGPKLHKTFETGQREMQAIGWGKCYKRIVNRRLKKHKIGAAWRRKWQPTSIFLPGKSHGLRILVGYSPWGHKESDMTERLHFTSLLSPRCGSQKEFLKNESIGENMCVCGGGDGRETAWLQSGRNGEHVRRSRQSWGNMVYLGNFILGLTLLIVFIQTSHCVGGFAFISKITW